MTARGIRNNNVGNLEKTAVKWQGEIDGDDPRFCTFESMTLGCRALIKTLRTYHERYRLCTIRQIIHRWAPDTENDTNSYVLSVSAALGRGVDESLPFDTDDSFYLAFAKAIARHECGEDATKIKESEWNEALKLAMM